ncbi:alpha/beta hydrolase [Sporosarcina sp. 179-K 8C2 HS]|uniref:alpha/beta fold hydrolase n=1 Tax=Sporosarcina sp. 179-K 8C2 HS TaxID=3142387 RepID=UPI0039A32C8E
MILHTNVYGDGEPVIFLHTGLQTGETDFVYQRNYFQDKYKVIFPDLRAHGKSKVDEVDMSSYFNQAANDLVDTLDQLKIDKAHVVGCSLGALVGLSLAKRIPQKVNSLVISGIIPQKPNDWNELRQKDAAMQNALLTHSEVMDYFNSIHKSDWQEFLAQSIEEDWYPFNETTDLSMLKCPVLYIVGEDKKHEVFGVSIYPNQNENIHVAVVPFASHLVHNEQPEVYTAILDLFFRKVMVGDSYDY